MDVYRRGEDAVPYGKSKNPETAIVKVYKSTLHQQQEHGRVGRATFFTEIGVLNLGSFRAADGTI